LTQGTTSRCRKHPGAILRVDLGDRWHTYARILGRIPKIAFYDCRVSEPMEDLRAITKRPVLFVGSGQCEIIDEAFNARPAAPEECVGLEGVAVWDPTHVEDRLRDHYAGRPNAHLAYMKVKLPGSG
jgi:hypothetical protein